MTLFGAEELWWIKKAKKNVLLLDMFWCSNSYFFCSTCFGFPAKESIGSFFTWSGLFVSKHQINWSLPENWVADRLEVAKVSTYPDVPSYPSWKQQPKKVWIDVLLLDNYLCWRIYSLFFRLESWWMKTRKNKLFFIYRRSSNSIFYKTTGLNSSWKTLRWPFKSSFQFLVSFLNWFGVCSINLFLRPIHENYRSVIAPLVQLFCWNQKISYFLLKHRKGQFLTKKFKFVKIGCFQVSALLHGGYIAK